MEKAILTSCSNKFFPTVITLIASIKTVYPEHPTIVVYDLGILPLFRMELEMIKNVKVVTVPAFCPHWKACYTWKPWIFVNPPARLNLYLDSGIQILKKLDSVFDLIEKDDYFAVGQNTSLASISPSEFRSIIKIDEKFYKETYVTAGLFGFKTDSKITPTLKDIYEASVAGLCLGFSPVESWRNKGKNKSVFVRDCPLFRFDTTVMSLLMRRDLGDFKMQPWKTYETGELLNDGSQIMWNARLKKIGEGYFDTKTLHEERRLIPILNRVYIHAFLKLKRISNAIKNKWLMRKK